MINAPAPIIPQANDICMKEEGEEGGEGEGSEAGGEGHDHPK